jgi:O-antigen/teichoic acid export membrane protein
VRFSAATAAERLLPQRVALRMAPLLSRIDAILFTADERGEASRVSLIAFAIRIVSAAIAFVSQVMMARWMGSFEYGIFVLVWVTMIIVGNLAGFGFHTSVIRFIPEYRERGLTAELRGILLASRLFVLAASTLLAGLGALGIWLFSPWIEDFYIAPFALGVILMPMIALSDLLQGMARSYSWALAALSPTYIVRPVLILVFMAAALLAGAAPDARTAILAAIAATYATTLAQLIGVTARIDRKVEAGPTVVHFSHWFAVSLPIFLVEGFFFVLTNADVLMVGAYLRPDEVAVYFATVKTLALVHFVYFAVKAGVAPRYAQFTHGEPDRLAAFARETVSWTFWPSLAMALLVLLLGKPMLMLFGPEFDAGYPILFLLVLGVVSRAAVGPCESLLTMSGNQNICAAVYAMALALNIGLNLAFIPLFGLWGAAIAVTLAMIFEATALSLTVWRKLGIAMAIFVPSASEAV